MKKPGSSCWGRSIYCCGLQDCVPTCCLVCSTCAKGLLPFLCLMFMPAEVSTSKERSFAAVDFVDTPGLVDGDMKVRAQQHSSCNSEQATANSL